MSYKLISVESRKGGVGKTTAALNLAYLLKDSYHVLLLDVDVTGTSIAVVENSKFWRNDVHVIKKDKKVVNLLKEFSGSFFQGKQDFEFVTIGENLLVEDGKINLLASELYGEKGELLYNPALIFDQLHVFWLTDMIKDICDRFVRAFSDKKETVVILDNSPGYVGLGHAVHQVLTDMGPKRGKMLSVSSLDIQDLESSVSASLVLHHVYLSKLDGALNWGKAQKGSDVFFQDSESESFFCVLASQGTEGDLIYYANPEELKVEQYQALIINRVPESILANRVEVDFNDRFKNSKSMKDMWDALCGNNPKDWMVQFDINLQKQFYEMSLHNKRVLKKGELVKIQKELNSIQHSAAMLSPEYRSGDYLVNFRVINKTNGAFTRLKEKLTMAGYDVIASKMKQEWWPMFPLRSLFDSLRDAGFIVESAEMIVPNKERIRSDVFLKRYGSDALDLLENNNPDLSFAIDQINYIIACYLLNPSLSIHGEELLNRWLSLERDTLHSFQSNFTKGRSLSSQLMNMSLAFHSEDDSFSRIMKEFYAACSRLTDFKEDTEIFSRMIQLISVEDTEKRYSEDVDYVSILDKKIITKEFSFEEAKDSMFESLKESDYMQAFRAVISKVIDRWAV